jgi:transketolase
MRSFGASAPAKQVIEHFGFTPAKVVEAVKASMARVARADGR